MKGLGQWIAIVLTAAGALASVAWTYGQNTQRITTIEKRQEEDRKETKESLRKVDEKVERIDGNVQKILQELRVMQDRARRGQR